MLLASSRINVENETICVNGFEPKNDPACGELRHEVEVFILTGIRAAAAKRRKKIHIPAFWPKACNFIELEPLCRRSDGGVWVKTKSCKLACAAS